MLYQGYSGSPAVPNTPVTAHGDPVAYVAPAFGSPAPVYRDAGTSNTQAPLYQTEAGRHWLLYDGVDDRLNYLIANYGDATRLVAGAAFRKADDTEAGHIFAATGVSGGSPIVQIVSRTTTAGQVRVTLNNGAAVDVDVPVAVGEDAVISFEASLSPSPLLRVFKNGVLAGESTASSGATATVWPSANGRILHGGSPAANEFNGRIYASAWATATSEADGADARATFDAWLTGKAGL
jgi:hypothetical protein